MKIKKSKKLILFLSLILLVPCSGFAQHGRHASAACKALRNNQELPFRMGQEVCILKDQVMGVSSWQSSPDAQCPKSGHLTSCNLHSRRSYRIDDQRIVNRCVEHVVACIAPKL